jgi:hypothetical protein
LTFKQLAKNALQAAGEPKHTRKVMASAS